MNVLIVGGTSGLGLILANKFSQQKLNVIVSGRHDPKNDFSEYRQLNLSGPDIASRIKDFVSKLPKIESLVYTAGYYQEGTVTDLSEAEIEEMLNVCGRGLIYFCKYLLEKQGSLDELIVITSSATWKLQRLEPVYSFVKAGEGHFANVLAEDGRIQKVLVVGPSGIKTTFWRDKKHPELGRFLDPQWVADQIIVARHGVYKYKYIRMLRNPAKLEVVETR